MSQENTPKVKLNKDGLEAGSLVTFEQIQLCKAKERAKAKEDREKKVKK